VNVQQEPGVRHSLGSLDLVYRDLVASSDLSVERCCHAVDHQPTDLGTGYPERLDEVAHGRPVTNTYGHLASAMPRWEKKPEWL
jgi:hypothetical protein